MPNTQVMHESRVLAADTRTGHIQKAGGKAVMNELLTQDRRACYWRITNLIVGCPSILICLQ